MIKINLQNIQGLKSDTNKESSMLYLVLLDEYLTSYAKQFFGFEISWNQFKNILSKNGINFDDIENAKEVAQNIRIGNDVNSQELEEAQNKIENFIETVDAIKKNVFRWNKLKIKTWSLYGFGRVIVRTIFVSVLFLLFGIPFLENFPLGQSIVSFLIKANSFMWRWIFIILVSISTITVSVVFVIFWLEKQSSKKSN